MKPVRVGVVRFLNTCPLIEGLDKCRDLELVAAVPSQITPMLERGDIDIGLVSTIDATRAGVPLSILPAGAIGCDGPTLTVRLFARIPPSEITRLAVDTDSHTSVVLAQVVLARAYGVRPKVVDFDAREGAGRGEFSDDPWPEALLLIGDKVVTASPPAIRYPYQIDLGQAWKDLTGLGFVYAVWMCRQADETDERIRAAAELIRRQRLRNQSRLDWIVTTRARERGWPDDLARAYLGQRLRFECDTPQRQAVSRFLEEAHHLGLAPQAEPRWLELSRPIGV
ncbi:MAG: menaquinone biosynthesis protein [Phycisphaerales bacterium]